MSSSSPVFSETDVHIYKTLANPTRANVALAKLDKVKKALAAGISNSESPVVVVNKPKSPPKKSPENKKKPEVIVEEEEVEEEEEEENEEGSEDNESDQNEAEAEEDEAEEAEEDENEDEEDNEDNENESVEVESEQESDPEEKPQPQQTSRKDTPGKKTTSASLFERQVRQHLNNTSSGNFKTSKTGLTPPGGGPWGKTPNVNKTPPASNSKRNSPIISKTPPSAKRSPKTKQQQQQQQKQQQVEEEYYDEYDEEEDFSESKETENNSEIEKEKQLALLELQKLKLKGVNVTRNYTLQDSLSDILFELEVHQRNSDAIQMVGFMKEGLKMVFVAVEGLNNRYGPILELDGWAEDITHDMSKFDAPLEKIYKRFFKKSNMNPFMELAWIILGSLGMWHVKSKLFGLGKKRMNPPPPPPTIFASAGAGAGSGGGGGGGGFDMFRSNMRFGPQTPQVPQVARATQESHESKRKVLGRPSIISPLQ